MALLGDMNDTETYEKFIEVFANLCDVCGSEKTIKIYDTILERLNKKLERLESEVEENDGKTV